MDKVECASMFRGSTGAFVGNRFTLIPRKANQYDAMYVPNISLIGCYADAGFDLK